VRAKLGSALLDWFRSAPRLLPWRGPFPRDPYLVLVSEVMAQQTQIDRVVPVFQRFVARFPSVEDLAVSEPDAVLELWSGLGYYRRGRLLHEAAKAIVARGAWPRTRAELAELPGLGPYTSAALAAFAFGGTDAPVDGNVCRVTARVEAHALPLGSPSLHRRGEHFARLLFDDVRTPEVWEAIMELGARVCTPRAPRCPTCPFRPRCRASRSAHPESYPLARPQRPSEDQRWVAVWIVRDDARVLLRRVADADLLGGLWLPPFAALGEGADPARLARALAADAGCPGRLRRLPRPVRHAITHRRIEVLPFVAPPVAAAAVAEVRDGWRWESVEAPAVPTSTLLHKLRDACRHVSPPHPAPDWPDEER
jgi:A/G-specific adenine glycosylase